MSTLLRTKDGKNSVTIGDYEVAIQVVQNTYGVEDALLQVELPETSLSVPVTGNQIAQYMDEHYPGALEAMRKAYGTLTTKSLSWKGEATDCKAWGAIPSGSVKYAIEGLNNLLSRDRESFSFNKDLQIGYTGGRTFEDNFALRESNFERDVLTDFVHNNLHLNPQEVQNKFIEAGMKVPSLSEIGLLRKKLALEDINDLILIRGNLETFDAFLKWVKEEVDAGRVNGAIYDILVDKMPDIFSNPDQYYNERLKERNYRL